MNRAERKMARRIERRASARFWLRQALAAGPVDADELRALARAAGLSATDICRVRPGIARHVYDGNAHFGSWAWELIPSGEADKP